jgi:amino acid permease
MTMILILILQMLSNGSHVQLHKDFVSRYVAVVIVIGMYVFGVVTFEHSTCVVANAVIVFP